MKINRNPLIIKGVKELHMDICESGYARTDPKRWPGKNVQMPFSRLYLIKGGEGWLKTTGQTVIMRPGYAYFIPTGIRFDYGCDDYVEKLYFHIRLIKPDGYDLAQGIDRFGECPINGEWLDRMIACYHSDRWLDAVALETGIWELLNRMLQQFSEQNTPIPRYSPLVERTLQYVQQHVSMRLRARDIAAALSISESTMVQMFRRETGHTLHQYVEDLIFQSAQTMLLQTEMPLGCISEELGFCDSFYFSRRFRQRYGEPPSVYRRRLKTAGQALLPFKDS